MLQTCEILELLDNVNPCCRSLVFIDGLPIKGFCNGLLHESLEDNGPSQEAISEHP